VLQVQNITKQFNRHVVVKDVSFHLQRGVCTALIGPNGAGKTTLLRIITGLIPSTEGTITFKDEDMDFRRIIGYLPQYPSFYEWMSGKEFLHLSSKLYGFSHKETVRRAEQVLDQVGLMKAKDKLIRTYSGGMKQRLGLAQALLHRPKILLLDEPVSSLDPIGRRDVLTLMERLKEEMTILFSTHILNDAEEVSDHLIMLKEGEVVEDGTIEDLQKKYATSKIIVQFEKTSLNVEALLSSLPSIISFERNARTYSFYVTDLKQARKEILKEVNKHHLPITQFQIGKVTMEEMFMKAVK